MNHIHDNEGKFAKKKKASKVRIIYLTGTVTAIILTANALPSIFTDMYENAGVVLARNTIEYVATSTPISPVETQQEKIDRYTAEEKAKRQAEYEAKLNRDSRQAAIDRVQAELQQEEDALTKEALTEGTSF